MDIYVIIQHRYFSDGYEVHVPLYAKYSIEEAEKEVNYLSNCENKYEPDWDTDTEYGYSYMSLRLT